MIEEVQLIVEFSIQKCISGHSIERPNLEFKSKWPILNKKGEGYYKFIRNLCSIANSTSDKFGIIVFGFDEKGGEFVKTDFRDTGLRDTSELQKLITKNVTEPFPIEIHTIDIGNNTLNIIIIKKSYAKPHVMGEYKTFKGDNITTVYKNYIPVRKETNINTANKYDLDLMYYDRKNTIFDKKTILIPLSISTEKVFNRSILKVLLIVENIGIRHVAFRNFYINITSLVDESQSYELSALSFKYFHSEEFTTPGSQSIIIKPNTIVDLEINFPNLFGQGFQTDKFVQNGIRFRTIIIGQTVEHEIVEGKFDQFFDLGQKEIKSI